MQIELLVAASSTHLRMKYSPRTNFSRSSQYRRRLPTVQWFKIRDQINHSPPKRCRYSVLTNIPWNEIQSMSVPESWMRHVIFTNSTWNDFKIIPSKIESDQSLIMSTGTTLDTLIAEHTSLRFSLWPQLASGIRPRQYELLPEQNYLMRESRRPISEAGVRDIRRADAFNV